MLVEISSPAPVLNTSDFSFAFGGNTGSEIPINHQGHPYCFEFVALKGMVFQVVESIRQELRDRPEITRTLLEGKFHSSIDDFPLQRETELSTTEKSSKSERLFSPTAVAFISLRSLRDGT